MFITKFIYNLIGQPLPSSDELDEEIDRLLYIKNIEVPTYVETSSSIDPEVISMWITRMFEPALILLLLNSEDNERRVKSELLQMKYYKSLVDKFMRANFVKKHALQRVREMCFDDSSNPKLLDVINKLKRTLTFLSNHLENNITLQNTDKYTTADITLYYYLKRILMGRYNDYGLKTHVNLCQPLMRFIARFASKNKQVVDISQNQNTDLDEPSLIQDVTKPAIVAMIFVLFYLWRHS